MRKPVPTGSVLACPEIRSGRTFRWTPCSRSCEWNGLPPDRMADRPVREKLASLVSWAGKAGLARVWRDQHGPDWWTEALKASGGFGNRLLDLAGSGKMGGLGKAPGLSPFAIEHRPPPVGGGGGPGVREPRGIGLAEGGPHLSRESSVRGHLPFLSSLMTAAPHGPRPPWPGSRRRQWCPRRSFCRSGRCGNSALRWLWIACERCSSAPCSAPITVPRVLQALQSELQIRHQPAETLSTALADALFESRASLTPEAWRNLWTVIVTWALHGEEPRGLALRPAHPHVLASLRSRGLVRAGPAPAGTRPAAFLPMALSSTLVLPGNGRAFLWCVDALWLALPPHNRCESPTPLTRTGPTPIEPGSTPMSSVCPPISTSSPAFSRLPDPNPHFPSGSVRPAEQPSPLSPRNRERLDSWERWSGASERIAPLNAPDHLGGGPRNRSRPLARSHPGGTGKS